MSYRFSLDDNIFLFADLSEQTYASLFDQPYLKFLRELHSEYGAKIQLNCYFETEGFCLRDMSGKYREEWEENADWLRLSFHARKDDPPNPYAEADYQELYQDCNMVQEEIRRFAGEKTLDLYTTLHYCQAAPEGVRALRDCGIKGLVSFQPPSRDSFLMLPHLPFLVKRSQAVSVFCIFYGMNSFVFCPLFEQII